MYNLILVHGSKINLQHYRFFLNYNVPTQFALNNVFG